MAFLLIETLIVTTTIFDHHKCLSTMSFELRIESFAFLILLPTAFCLSYWNLTRAVDRSPKFEALVEKQLNDSYQYCSGVILNNRYVLTIYSCTRDHNHFFPAKNIKIYVGVVNYGISFKIYRGAAAQWEHEVEEIWPGDYDDTFAPLRSLALLRTTTPIKYNLNVRCISLPKDYYIVWKYSFTIPNSVVVTSSLWCLDQDGNHALFVRTGVRNCSDETISKTPNWLVASCMKHKRDKMTENCIVRVVYDLKNRSKISPVMSLQWPRGLALVYNDTLVGMRNYRKARSGPPFSTIQSEIFVNVAKYTETLENHMKQPYQPCYL